MKMKIMIADLSGSISLFIGEEVIKREKHFINKIEAEKIIYEGEVVFISGLKNVLNNDWEGKHHR